jgi:hypothetical protein
LIEKENEIKEAIKKLNKKSSNLMRVPIPIPII